jgi:hypothetical protein
MNNPMSNLQIIIVGWLVGQFGYAAVSIHVLQRHKPNINYWEAAGAYFRKEFSNFVMAFAGLLILIFIFPDFWDADINKMDLKIKSTKTWKEWIMIYQRVTTVVIGGLSQHLLYIAFKRGKKEIEKLDEQKANENIE